MKIWSQIIYVSRNGEDVEVEVSGGFNPVTQTLTITSITDLHGNPFKLDPGEMDMARDDLYDSMFNYTGPGEKYKP